MTENPTCSPLSTSCTEIFTSFGRKKPLLFYPPPLPVYFITASVLYRSYLIDWFGSSADTILCHETYISCTNVICIVSWSLNFVFKVNEWHFFYPWQKSCVSMTPNRAPLWYHLFWQVLKTSFPYFTYFWYIWILSGHFSRLLFILCEVIIGFSFN